MELRRKMRVRVRVSEEADEEEEYGIEKEVKLNSFSKLIWFHNCLYDIMLSHGILF